MPNDFIPPGDPDFHKWQSDLLTYANANLAPLGLTAGQMAPVGTAQSTWIASFAAHKPAVDAARAATVAKDNSRAGFETLLRSLIAQLQARPTVTDTQRAAMGLPVYKKTRTPTSVPTTRPVVLARTDQRFCHLLTWADETSPGSTRKPKGVEGAELWVKIGGEPPVDMGECTFLAFDTASPYLAEYPGTQKNKTAHYMLRWVNARGEKGPWSETVSATITG